MMEIQLSPKIIYEPFKRQIKLSFNKYDNIINLNGDDFELCLLDDDFSGSKGGNSNVFLLKDPSSEDEDFDQIIIKICNQPLELSSSKYKKRFQREVIALKKAKTEKKAYIIKYFHHGILVIDGKRFPFYTMEKADSDLAKHLSQNNIPLPQKILLCLSVIRGFKDLHSLKIYHRDIKHDNLFLINSECKIGDLGLVRFRDDDTDFIRTEIGDRIGAFGWESPETMNKFLTERNENYSFDINIDNKSDIFQIGKLFWYIFQGNLPIGQIVAEDFRIEDDDIFQVIFNMLQHSNKPDRRVQSIEEVERLFIPLAKKYSVI